MSSARLPDFEHTLAIAQGNLEAHELSECHGVACGLLSRHSDASLDAYVGLLDMLEMVNSPGTGLKMSLEELLNSSREFHNSTPIAVCSTWLIASLYPQYNDTRARHLAYQDKQIFHV